MTSEWSKLPGTFEDFESGRNGLSNGPRPIFRQDDEAYAHYDAMTARELFRSAGVSARLYREFLEPILLVTLFAPGEQLSGERTQNHFGPQDVL